MTRKDRKMSKNYIFGDHLGNLMSAVPMEVQMQASLMSMSLLMIGFVVLASYIVLFSEFALFFKIMTGINAVCGVVFMWSYLVTIFQQYKAYMETQELLASIAGITSSEQQLKGGIIQNG